MCTAVKKKNSKTLVIIFLEKKLRDNKKNLSRSKSIYSGREKNPVDHRTIRMHFLISD